MSTVYDKIVIGSRLKGDKRVLRGGSWINNARHVRSANRNANDPDNANNNIGFRLARALAAISRWQSDQVSNLSNAIGRWQIVVVGRVLVGGLAKAIERSRSDFYPASILSNHLQ